MMNIKGIVIAGMVMVGVGLPQAWSQSYAELRAEVAALYDKADRSLEAKDLETYMSLFADDYRQIFAGTDRQQLRNSLRIRMGYDQLRASYTILSITRSGNSVKVVDEQKLEGKSGDKDWSVLSESTVVDLLVAGTDGLKFSRSAEIDRERLDRVNGRTYKDEQTGLSLSVPVNWEIFPGPAARMQGGLYILAPDRSSVVMYGHVRVPDLSAKQAVEGDETVTKLVSPDTYKQLNSGSIRVQGHDGFESESEFLLPGDRARHRRRVYFSDGDLLHVFCFDAIPPKQWDALQDSFQYILDSVRVEQR